MITATGDVMIVAAHLLVTVELGGGQLLAVLPQKPVTGAVNVLTGGVDSDVILALGVAGVVTDINDAVRHVRHLQDAAVLGAAQHRTVVKIDGGVIGTHSLKTSTI